MKRLLALSLLAAAALPAGVRSQPEEDFGILKTGPATAPRPAPSAPSSLPAGMEPAAPPASAPAPNPYPLPADAPPHLICAGAFAGPDGAELARQLCAELRTKHNLKAYVYNRGDEERKQQEDEWKRLKAAYPGVPLRKKGVRIVDNYAVLVAGWADFKQASEYLPNVKKLPMPELILPGGRQAYDVQAFQDVDPQTHKPVTRYGRVNPYHSAMVTRNPLAPRQTAARPKFDPFWIKLNADEEYSLLKSKGKYTLVVKEYTGAREIQAPTKSEGLLETIGFKGKSNDQLDAAAAQAHEVAKFLRSKEKMLGFKAYVFHTRNSSLVTVGAFSSADDPEMQRVLRVLAEVRFGSQQGGGGNDPLGLMQNPIPIEVPRP